MIVIDLINGDDIISLPKEETPEELARKEEMRLEALRKIFERSPRPETQVIPVEVNE